MTRALDPQWEAMLDAFLLRNQPLNDNERGKLNKARRLWVQSQGTPEEWALYVGWYKRVWPNVPLTAMAVASNRTTLKAEALKAGLLRRVVSPSAPPPVPELPPRADTETARAHLAAIKRGLNR